MIQRLKEQKVHVLRGWFLCVVMHTFEYKATKLRKHSLVVSFIIKLHKNIMYSRTEKQKITSQ